ncbi:MAG TPA: hypothetical protein VEV38_03385, partial [Candidatus Eremiobacteraceae bacterium]|nr:hypothetical protein [Candidatus Eremiobacteraceae bacterium]
QPPIARSMLQYRFDRLSGAERNAAAHGYRGAMFPWESGASGEEDTPVWALTGPFEQHITADVGIAAWNYYCVTHDKYWLQSEGYPLLKETADFWTSRVTRNGPGRYDIVNVVAADEFAQNVDDNAFTNAAAREDLEDASAAARVLGTAPDPDWANVAKNIPILKFPDGTVREYAGYNGQQTKQADVELLGYPLHAISDSSTIRRDLDYYGARIANGPAMTQSIYAILQERLGMPETAFATFEKGYRSHEVAPFDTISEVAGDTNVYFATGAGGFLQTMLYGFGGLEITPQGIVQRPTRLPAEWRSLTLTGIGPHLKTYVIRSSDQKPKAAAH